MKFILPIYIWPVYRLLMLDVPPLDRVAEGGLEDPPHEPVLGERGRVRVALRFCGAFAFFFMSSLPHIRERSRRGFLP